jgi:hypothetical protein
MPVCTQQGLLYIIYEGYGGVEYCNTVYVQCLYRLQLEIYILECLCPLIEKSLVII